MRVARARAERVLAEVWEAGASGLEEREAGDAVSLIVYVPTPLGDAVAAAARAIAGPDAVAPPEPVPEADWSEAWKRELAPLEISSRLVVRPPFASHPLADGQDEVVIEPRQAFGTGAHASTWLALELIDQRLAARPGGRMLDVGCGSGVLALAALRLGAERAVALDLDPLAPREAAENARRNGLGDRLEVLLGPVAALAGRGFELVAANLLRRELEPELAAITGRVASGGALVLAGLLATERAGVERALADRGFRVAASRTRDAGGDSWLGLLTMR